MSLIKSIMHQLGLSGDPAKNFTLEVPAAPDGTMKLARGNAGATTQDIMTVDAAGKVAFPQGPVQDGPAFRASATALSWGGGLIRVLLGTEQFDTNNNFDTVLSRFTPTVAGYYQVNGAVQTDTSNIRAVIYKNGAANSWGSIGGSVVSNVADLIYMNGTTDYLELYANAVGGTSINTTDSITYFSASLVRKA